MAHHHKGARDANGGFRRLSNAEIARNPHYGDLSLEQAKFGTDEFYDRMDDVMSPAPAPASGT